MTDKWMEQIFQGENVREALSKLRAQIKEGTPWLRARKRLGDGAALAPLLSSEDAKVRKNAAALIGDLRIKAAAGALFDAYQKEQTLFVRPALLLALNETDPYPYLGELEAQYRLLCGKDVQENEKKHIREELHALEKILREEGPDVRHTFTGWDVPLTVLLTANPRFVPLVEEALGECRKKAMFLGVQAAVANLRGVVQIRTFRELLFPIVLKEKLTAEDGPEALGAAVAGSKLLPLLKHCHKEAGPFLFRMDARAGILEEGRVRFVKKAAAAIEEASGRQLLNAPDHYEFELRLYASREGILRVFLKMNTIPMERFSYRKKTISASIHPSEAAAILKLARPYLKKQAQALDPCCGVGTMLIERQKLLPARELCGIDIFGEAVEKAKANAEAANVAANFIQKDFTNFVPEHSFDEIIANMPTRGKRSKEEQDTLFRDFFDKFDKILAPGGILILFSNENGFVKKQIRLHPAFLLEEEYLIREKEQFFCHIVRH